MDGFERRKLLRESRNAPITEQEQQIIDFLIKEVEDNVTLDPMPSSTELEDWALQLISTFNTIGLMPLRRKKDLEMAQRIFRKALADLRYDVEDRLKKLLK